jgi:hypothetical protein
MDPLSDDELSAILRKLEASPRQPPSKPEYLPREKFRTPGGGARVPIPCESLCLSSF